MWRSNLNRVKKRYSEWVAGSDGDGFADERERFVTNEAYVLVGTLQAFLTPVVAAIVILTCGTKAVVPAFIFYFLLIFVRGIGVIYILAARVSYGIGFKKKPWKVVALIISFLTFPIALFIKYPNNLPPDNHLSLVLGTMQPVIIIFAVTVGVLLGRNRKG